MYGERKKSERLKIHPNGPEKRDNTKSPILLNPNAVQMMITRRRIGKFRF
jgi:hypothetical protein